MNLKNYFKKSAQAQQNAPFLAALKAYKKWVRKDMEQSSEGDARLSGFSLEFLNFKDAGFKYVVTLKYGSPLLEECHTAKIEIDGDFIEIQPALTKKNVKVICKSIIDQLNYLEGSSGSEQESAWHSIPNSLREKMALYLAMYIGIDMNSVLKGKLKASQYNVEVYAYRKPKSSYYKPSCNN